MQKVLRIFISSTTNDLGAERDAVEQAIAGLNLEAIRSETVGSQSISPREACRIMAQECDVYLGILGGRYGFTLKEGGSVTEFEFNTARQAGKPILLYRKEVPEEELEAAQRAFIERIGDFDTGYYHLLVTIVNPTFNFVDNLVNRQALLSASHQRHNAIGAKVVATILNLDKGAGSETGY